MANLFFTSLIQKEGINCALKCNFNWFKKTFSRKRSAPLWKGLYFCKECNNEFLFSVDADDNSDFMLTISYIPGKNMHHDLVSSSKRFTGKERAAIALEVMAYGTSKVHNKNILFNNECDDPQESNTP
jgi:hypothetical protein